MLRTHPGVISFGSGNTYNLSKVWLFHEGKWTAMLPMVYADGRWEYCGTKFAYDNFLTLDQGQLVELGGQDFYVRS